MPSHHDGPATPLFRPIPLRGNTTFKALLQGDVSDALRANVSHAMTGACTCWGIPFAVKRPIVLRASAPPLTVKVEPFRAPWLVYLHTTDIAPLEWNAHGFVSPTTGEGRLNEHIADYVLRYADGTEARLAVRRRHHIQQVQRSWGEGCFQAVAARKPAPIQPHHEIAGRALKPGMHVTPYGWATTRARHEDILLWCNWVYAWENPHPEKRIVALRFEPVADTVILSGVSAGTARHTPLRWERRRKALLRLPKGVAFDTLLDGRGLLEQLQIDLGQVISAQPRTRYPNEAWAKTYNNQIPEICEREILVEYTAHPDAHFHLWNGKRIPVARLEETGEAGPFETIAPATQRVRLRVVEKGSGKPVPVKLHVHGEAGEYLAPVDRHRLPNYGWIEDYSIDFLNACRHVCTYIPGETMIDLPLGNVYLEVSKGFEIKPLRKALKVTARTRTLTLTLDRVLPWRARGWVTADTHVHFLSPATARLEGAAEGVNVVNLLASQWGELMTNAGDFDGASTYGTKEAGGDGEHLVRVGSENRQHVLGHISLLGYSGSLIAPMCSGGPDESALGDPVEVLMGEWARQCRAQGGLVVMPHFPSPRCEHAANIVDGVVDAIEMCSWGNLYAGVNPYSLSDWYRFLNCGYFLPAVGGTDKMSADTPVGAIRTYVKLPPDRPFTFPDWMDAVRAGNTFVTYGPLIEFAVDGHAPGQRIAMTRSGGTVEVAWSAASCTLPLSRVDLVVNGEIRESKCTRPWEDAGHWRVRIERSSWLALLVRGHYRDKPEIVAAHSSAVPVEVEGSKFFSAVDAITMLDQIEGALAFLDTVGTRAETKRYKEMRLKLTATYRRLHNELHRSGIGHAHTHATDHPEHR